jgi:hypothetical protein
MLTAMANPRLFDRFRNADASLLVRTDFTDDTAWAALQEAVEQPESSAGFKASLSFLSDPSFAGLAPDVIAAQVNRELNHPVVFIADTRALTGTEHQVLCLDARSKPRAFFRVIPEEIWGPENNLRLGNMDFADFASAVGKDGVFRGF